MVRAMRWLPVGAAMATVALAAPTAGAQEKTPTANGSGGAAASVDPLATQAAIDVMTDGGNAFDAAIAAASVLGVVEPYSCGIGGGGFMVIRDGETGDITTIDSREKSPRGDEAEHLLHRRQAADRRAVLDQPLQRAVRRRARHAVRLGVPAAQLRHVHAQGGAHLRRPGRRPTASWSTRRSSTRRRRNAPYFDDIPSTAAIYLDADGTSKDVGTVVKNPDMAKTYS